MNPDLAFERRDEIAAEEAPYVNIVTGTYVTQNIEVTFQGTRKLADYGVPDSSFTIVEDFEITQLFILGIEVDPKAIPEDLLEACRDFISEVDFE